MEAILKKFSALSTPSISDALEGRNNLDFSIKPLDENYRLCGRAMTVKAPVGDNLIILQALRQSEPGKVLVVDMKGETYRSVMGDFMVTLAKNLGFLGLVFDGVVRDIQEIKALNFPVFCKGICIAASSKAGGGEIDVPISCGGVAINPGDIIVGDANGVVVVPKEREDRILTEALLKEEKDEKRLLQYGVNRETAREYLDSLFKN